MGAQRAFFVAEAAEPEFQNDGVDHERTELPCQLVTDVGDDYLDCGPAIEPSEEAIRLRSQQIWEGEGCPEGYAQDHWMRARAELAALMARTSKAQLTAAMRPMDDALPAIPGATCTMGPELSQSTPSSVSTLSALAPNPPAQIFSRG